MRFHSPLFFIGILLITVGAIWAGIILSETNKSISNFTLENNEVGSQSIMIKGKGIGFYLISSESYQNNILAKVMDSQGNFLDIRKISNKITLDYFHFKHNDQVTLILTNLSEKPVQLSTIIGDTKVEEITPPAILIFSGSIILIFSGYKKLRNYITEHPDENNS